MDHPHTDQVLVGGGPNNGKLSNSLITAEIAKYKLYVFNLKNLASGNVFLTSRLATVARRKVSEQKIVISKYFSPCHLYKPPTHYHHQPRFVNLLVGDQLLQLAGQHHHHHPQGDKYW